MNMLRGIRQPITYPIQLRCPAAAQVSNAKDKNSQVIYLQNVMLSIRYGYRVSKDHTGSVVKVSRTDFRTRQL